MLIILVCFHQCIEIINLEKKLQSNDFILLVLEFREKKEWYISILFVNSRATIIYNVVWVISMNWIYIIYDLCLNAIRRY